MAGGRDRFELGRLTVAEEVLLLDSDAATAMLQHCSSSTAAFEAYLANTGLFQATHMSLQESECAEALHQAATHPETRPERKEGLMKWFEPNVSVATFLNDGWYANTLRLVCPPLDIAEHHTLAKALFPDTRHTTIKGFARKSLSPTGITALFALCASLCFNDIDLSSALADGVQGAQAISIVLQVNSLLYFWCLLRVLCWQEGNCELISLDLSSNDLGAAGAKLLAKALPKW